MHLLLLLAKDNLSNVAVLSPANRVALVEEATVLVHDCEKEDCRNCVIKRSHRPRTLTHILRRIRKTPDL